MVYANFATEIISSTPLHSSGTTRNTKTLSQNTAVIPKRRSNTILTSGSFALKVNRRLSVARATAFAAMRIGSETNENCAWTTFVRG